MQPEASTTRSAPPEDLPKDRTGPSVPERLAAILRLVRILLGHGRRLTETVPATAARPSFCSLAAVAGTHATTSILTRIQRGILRLIALENYLLARAQKGRDIKVRAEHDRAPPRQKHEPPAEAPARPRRLPFDPDSLHIPTMEEMEKEVRRRPVGLTITYICIDLAVVPGFCTLEFWSEIRETLRHYGGSMGALCIARLKREQTYKRERDRHPDTWNWDWWDLGPPRGKQILGYLIGEPPTLDPPGLPLATAPP